jgi:hypothetical protein
MIHSPYAVKTGFIGRFANLSQFFADVVRAARPVKPYNL